MNNKTKLFKSYIIDLGVITLHITLHIHRYLDESEDSVVSPDEFKKMLDELFVLNGVLNIGDSIPWIDFMDLQGYVKRMKAVSKKFDRFLEHVLDEHNERRRADGEGFVAMDMVDLLLQVADDPTLEVKIERHGVKAFTQVINLLLYLSLYMV